MQRTNSPLKTHLTIPVTGIEARQRASSAPVPPLPHFRVDGAVPQTPSRTSSGDQTPQEEQSSPTVAPLQAPFVSSPSASSSSSTPSPAKEDSSHALAGHISEQRAAVFRLHQAKTMKFIPGTEASAAIRKVSRQKLREALEAAGYKFDLGSFKKWESTILQTIYSPLIDLHLDPNLNPLLKSSRADISDEECSGSESEYPGQKINNSRASEGLGNLYDLFYAMLTTKITERHRALVKERGSFAQRPSAATKETTATLDNLLKLMEKDVSETLEHLKKVACIKDELPFKEAVKKETRAILASVAAFSGGTATSLLGGGVGVATGTAAAIAWPVAAVGVTVAGIGAATAVAAVTKTHQAAVKAENEKNSRQLEVLIGRSGLDHRLSATDSSQLTHHTSLVMLPSHVKGKLLSLPELKNSHARAVAQLQSLKAQRESLLQEQRRSSASGNTPSPSQSSSSSSSNSTAVNRLSLEIDSLTVMIAQYHAHLDGLNTDIARLTSKAQSEGSVRRHFHQFKQKLTRRQEHADTEPLNTPVAK